MQAPSILFEIRNVFQEKREEIGKVGGNFKIHRALEEYGEEQIEANLEHMLLKEG